MSYTSSSCSTHRSHSYGSDSSASSMVSDMSSSTPSKRGVAGVTKPTLDNVKPHLREDVDNKLFSGASIENFVQYVWGLDAKDIRFIKAHFNKDSNPLDKESFTTYQTLCRDSSNEKYLYKPFQDISEVLTASVRNSLGLSESPVVYWNKLGQHVMKSLVVKRKPDMLPIYKNITIPTWMIALSSVEFKKTRKRGNDGDGLTSQIPEGGMADPSTSIAASGSGSQMAKSKKKSAKERRTHWRVSSTSKTTSRSSSAAPNPNLRTSDTDEGESLTPARIFGLQAITIPSQDHSLTSTHSTSSGAPSQKKRKHSIDNSGPAAKRPRPPAITNDQLQLATYALECMDVSTRHYTTGIFIDKFKISLWYYDRACIIRTVNFDFREAPECLALVVFAISNCDTIHAGFDPHMHADPTNVSPGIDKPLSTVIGARLEFPNAKFQINKVLFEYRGLIGRGTMVYDVTRLFDDGHSQDNQALKLSWPLIVRPLEVLTITKLRAAISGWKDHLPDIKFSVTFTSKELNLPRLELIKGLSNCSELEDRQLHVLAMKKYKKLWEVGSVAEFKDVFVDCLECHYHAHTTGKVLHRDLSENNLMFDREGDVIRGILNDWDMASLLDDVGEVLVSTARHRTGTIPFMATELLEPNPPTHLYRHDLESFFYILVWAAMNYDLGRKNRCAIQKDIAFWDRDLTSSGQSKDSFIMNNNTSTRMLAQVRPEFEEVTKEWIQPLLKLFRLGRTACMYPEMALTQPYDHATYGGYVTFHNFMKALGRTPRHRPNGQAATA